MIYHCLKLIEFFTFNTFFTVGGLGILVMCVACTISNFDATIIRILFSINGCLSGPVLGVYTLGAFFPSANSKVSAYYSLKSKCHKAVY